MKVKLLSGLVSLFNVIRNELVLSANTKTRIADALENTARTAHTNYDPDLDTYWSGQTVWFNDKPYTALEDIPKGKGPDSDKKNSWRTGFVISLDQLAGADGKLVAASVLNELRAKYDAEGAKSIPYATESVAGKLLLATEDDHNKGVGGKAATPKWVLALINAALKGYEALIWSDVLTSKPGANSVDVDIKVRSLSTPLTNPLTSADGFTIWVHDKDSKGNQVSRHLEEVSVDTMKLIFGTSNTPTIPANKTIVALLPIPGPDSIDEGVLTTQYLLAVKYDDGTTGTIEPSDANKVIRSIVGQGEQVDQKGIVPIYSNAITGDTRSFTLRYSYRLPNQTEDTTVTKTVTINDRTVTQDIVLGNLIIPHYDSDDTIDYVGQLEGVSCDEGIRIWGLDAAHPENHIVVEFLRDGVAIGEAEVNRSRADVSEALGLINNAGHIYGLVWPIPDQYKDSLPHKYTARFKGTNILVQGEAISVTCTKPDNANCPNLALLTNGGTVLSSSSIENPNELGANRAFNGDRTGRNSNGNFWWNSTPVNSFPQWLQRNFDNQISAKEFELVFLQNDFANGIDPDDTTESSYYGVVNFALQYRSSDSEDWKQVPSGIIENNIKTVRRVRLSNAISGKQFRVVISSARDGYCRIVEFIIRGCLTGPADVPVSIAILNSPQLISEGNQIDIDGIITYSDGRKEKADYTNSIIQLAADTGDYDTATQTHAATASGAYIGINKFLVVDNNNVRGDTRNIRLKMSAYGLSDIKTITIKDTTPAPSEPKIISMEWRWVRNKSGNDVSNRVYIFIKVDGPTADVWFSIQNGTEPVFITTLKDADYANDVQGFTHEFDLNVTPGNTISINANPTINGVDYLRVAAAFICPTGATTDRQQFYPQAN